MEKCLWALEDADCKISTFASKVKLCIPYVQKIN